MTGTFGDAVRSVRAGQDASAAARDLYDRLEEDERLWLLDGDTEFWEGLGRFRSEGYNRTPLVHGAVERLGLRPRLVEGSAANIKVTAPGDLRLAEAILRQQERW